MCSLSHTKVNLASWMTVIETCVFPPQNNNALLDGRYSESPHQALKGEWQCIDVTCLVIRQPHQA